MSKQDAPRISDYQLSMWLQNIGCCDNSPCDCGDQGQVDANRTNLMLDLRDARARVTKLEEALEDMAAIASCGICDGDHLEHLIEIRDECLRELEGGDA